MRDEELADLVARVAVAIQKAGPDHLGPVEEVHGAFLRVLAEMKRMRAVVEAAKKWVHTHRHGGTYIDETANDDALIAAVDQYPTPAAPGKEG